MIEVQMETQDKFEELITNVNADISLCQDRLKVSVGKVMLLEKSLSLKTFKKLSPEL